jgi:hypothetical protein
MGPKARGVYIPSIQLVILIFFSGTCQLLVTYREALICVFASAPKYQVWLWRTASCSLSGFALACLSERHGASTFRRFPIAATSFVSQHRDLGGGDQAHDFRG